MQHHRSTAYDLWPVVAAPTESNHKLSGSMREVSLREKKDRREDRDEWEVLTTRYYRRVTFSVNECRCVYAFLFVLFLFFHRACKLVVIVISPSERSREFAEERRTEERIRDFARILTVKNASESIEKFVVTLECQKELWCYFMWNERPVVLLRVSDEFQVRLRKSH